MAKLKFFASRIDFRNQSAREKFLNDVLSLTESNYEYNTVETNKYRFLGPAIFFVLNTKYVHARLIRIKDEEVPVFNSSTSDKTDVAIVENAIINENRIFINTENGTIAHTMSRLDADTFEHVMTDLFNGCAIDKKFEEEPVDKVVNVRSIDDDFDDKFRTMTKILRIDIKLRPTNPHSQPIYEDIDDRLHKLKVSKLNGYKERYNAEFGGELDAKGDNEIKAKIAMAKDKYGEVEIIGLDDNDGRVVINTSGLKKFVVLDSNLTIQQMSELLNGFLRTVFQ